MKQKWSIGTFAVVAAVVVAVAAAVVAVAVVAAAVVVGRSDVVSIIFSVMSPQV